MPKSSRISMGWPTWGDISTTWSKLWQHVPIPRIFLNPTLRFTALRILCLSSFIDAIVIVLVEGRNDPTLLVLLACMLVPAVTFVHHFGTALGPTTSWRGDYDLAMVMMELSSRVTLSTFTFTINRWLAQEAIFLRTLFWIEIVSLFSIALMRIAETVKRRGRNLKLRVDVTGVTWAHEIAGDQGSRNGSASDRPNGFHVLIGRAIWKSQFLGESQWIILSRGILSVLIIMAIIIFALFNIVLDPVRETGLTPVKELRSSYLPADFSVDRGAVWNVVLTRMLPTNRSWTPLPSDNTTFTDAVSIIPLWDGSNDNRPACSPIPVAVDPMRIDGVADQILETIAYHCPPRVPIPDPVNLFFSHPRRGIFLLPYQDSRPTLLVTVNFTVLGISSNETSDLQKNSVQVFLALTNDTASVVERTAPTTLFPGLNLMGFAKIIIRQVFKTPSSSAFGFFDPLYTFAISEMVHTYPDPRSVNSTLITRSPDIATIRISAQNDVSELTIVQDYRDKSVVAGFANVGGLWTFVAGIFAALFGSPLVRILFGIKPLSVFGFLHEFQQAQIREACLTEYPRIIDEFKTPHSQRGIVSLLCDYLIDVNILAKEVELSVPSEIARVSGATDVEDPADRVAEAGSMPTDTHLYIPLPIIDTSSNATNLPHG